MGTASRRRGGHSHTFLTHEPYSSAKRDPVEPERLSGHHLARRASVLIHDAQSLEEEYAGRIGWGHSTVAHAVAFARAARAHQRVLFHHDPLHSDGDLAVLDAHAAQLWGGGSEPPQLAREGMRVGLREDVAELAASG